MQKLSLLVLVVLAACGDDPVSFSAPVGINLKAKSGDVSNNVVSDEKGITTESSNPYGAFVTDARAQIGRDPGSIPARQPDPDARRPVHGRDKPQRGLHG